LPNVSWGTKSPPIENGSTRKLIELYISEEEKHNRNNNDSKPQNVF
jgi:hypothetical protein